MLFIDEKLLPEEVKKTMPTDALGLPPGPPKPEDGGVKNVEGQEIFMLPEPEMDWAEGVRKEEITISDIPCLTIRRDGTRRDFVLMHIHGGGFTGGNAVSAYRLMDEAIREFNMDSYSVLYTLVPTATAPTQLEQCLSFYQGLLDLGYEKIILAGESAGANLCLALTLELKKLGKQLPETVIACSPPVDFTGLIDRHDNGNQHDLELGRMYAGALPTEDVRVSPYFGDYNGFPPLLLQAGGLENLKYDSIALGEKIKDTDCDCTLSIYEGGFHAFGIDPGETYVHKTALRQILDFMKEKAKL